MSRKRSGPRPHFLAPATQVTARWRVALLSPCSPSDSLLARGDACVCESRGRARLDNWRGSCVQTPPPLAGAGSSLGAGLRTPALSGRSTWKVQRRCWHSLRGSSGSSKGGTGWGKRSLSDAAGKDSSRRACGRCSNADPSPTGGSCPRLPGPQG